MEKNISPSRFPLKSDFKGFIKIMKTCLLFLFAFTFHIMAFNSNAQDAIIELKANTITVSQLITEIEKQTDYFVVYSNREVDTSRTVYLKNRSNKVSEYLNQAFSDTDIGYDFEKNYIVLSKKAEKPISITTNLVRTTQQQGKTVRGSVTDVNGDPVIGVTIVVKDNPSQGTVTDMDGNFILSNLPENAVLQITYVGMKQQEILVENKTIIDVVMIEETIGLEEVVAIGYGTQKRVTLTGAIATTRGDEILKSKSPNVLNSLVGKLPGVIINTRSGEPGRDNPSFLIRGRNTTGNSNPLIIVDGVQRDDLGLINPSDIEDITVLKDATAAIYGARSANGVVLVTTKRGKESVPIFNFSYNQGFSQPTRNIKMADAYTFAKVYKSPLRKVGADVL